LIQGFQVRKFRWLLLACIVGVVLAALALLLPSPGVTKENFDRIEVGMVRSDVEAIFGGPAYVRRPHDRFYAIEWDNDASGEAAVINFEENGRVASKEWCSDWPDDRSLWQKMLGRLPWREKPPPRPRFRP
jgi:hypothetical protein